MTGKNTYSISQQGFYSLNSYFWKISLFCSNCSSRICFLLDLLIQFCVILHVSKCYWFLTLHLFTPFHTFSIRICCFTNCYFQMLQNSASFLQVTELFYQASSGVWHFTCQWAHCLFPFFLFWYLLIHVVACSFWFYCLTILFFL